MSTSSDLPKELQALVTDVGRPVTSQDVDAYRQLQRIKDDTLRIRTVLKAWKEEQTQDRNLRDRYAFWLMLGLGVQVVTITTIYILMGLELLKYEVWTANTFIMGVFSPKLPRWSWSLLSTCLRRRTTRFFS